LPVHSSTSGWWSAAICSLLAGLLQLLLALVQRRVLALFGELATAAGGEPLLGLTEQGQLVVRLALACSRRVKPSSRAWRCSRIWRSASLEGRVCDVIEPTDAGLQVQVLVVQLRAVALFASQPAQVVAAVVFGERCEGARCHGAKHPCPSVYVDT
jgi:membrane protein implicated in regulation of membrane protease activity